MKTCFNFHLTRVGCEINSVSNSSSSNVDLGGHNFFDKIVGWGDTTFLISRLTFTAQPQRRHFCKISIYLRASSIFPMACLNPLKLRSLPFEVSVISSASWIFSSVIVSCLDSAAFSRARSLAWDSSHLP